MKNKRRKKESTKGRNKRINGGRELRKKEIKICKRTGERKIKKIKRTKMLIE